MIKPNQKLREIKKTKEPVVWDTILFDNRKDEWSLGKLKYLLI